MSNTTQAASHPEPEDLGSFVDGTADARAIHDITTHIATCNECLDAIRSSVEFLWEEALNAPREPATSSRWLSKSRIWLAVAAAAIVALIGVATFRQRVHGGSGASLESLADAAPRDYRIVEPRLIGFRWAAMQTFREEGSRPPADPAYLKMETTAGDVLTRARSDNSAEAAHAAGVAKLLLRDPTGAVALLDAASTQSPADAHVWNDLAAARLAEAVQEKQPADLSLALAAVDRALKLDGRLPDALFNRALILQKLGLGAQEDAAWQTYLEVDSNSAWAAEARRHLHNR